MGCSISNCVDSFDNSINDFLFQPPLYRPSNKELSMLKYCPITDNLLISYLEIIPPEYEFIPVNQQKYIVFSHGNACLSFELYSYLENLSQQINVAVIVYDYVGYGYSKSLSGSVKPNEINCYRSHEIMIDTLLKTGISQNNITLVGQSIGTGIVCDYLAKFQWKTPAILISPYRSILDIGSSLIFGTSSSFLNYTNIGGFNSMKKLPQILCPIKIIHGEDDELIPIDHGRDLHNSQNNKSLSPLWLADTGHNDILLKISPNIFLEVVNKK